MTCVSIHVCKQKATESVLHQYKIYILHPMYNFYSIKNVALMQYKAYVFVCMHAHI